MGFFKKAYNGFAEFGNKMNKGVNKVIGKEVFGEIRPIEDPQVFADYSTFPQYEKDEPGTWSSEQGEEKVFNLSGATVKVSSEFDTCMRYRQKFAEAANYYTERFKYKYSVCVNSFDTLTHYFMDIYREGLHPMLYRAYSLLLPFGVFDIDNNSFNELHVSLFNRAIQSYQAMCGIEESINQKAQNIGDTVGGAVTMQGGGFGLKGAMKGVAKAEAFNFGMGLIGKYVSNQMKMTPQQKAAAFEAFKEDLFFEEVYSDYYNTFLTLIHALSQRGLIKDVKVISDDTAVTMINNLKNPMFPKERIPQSLATLISMYPFEESVFSLAEELLGKTSECESIKEYFLG